MPTNDSIEIERFVLNLPEGPCVILKKEQAFDRPRFANKKELYDFLNDSCFNESGLVFRNGLSPWTEANPLSFNCHTFAVGSLLGVSPNYWIEGQSSPGTLHRNPLELLFNNFFTQVFEISKSNHQELKDMSPHEDDVIALTKPNSDDITFVHTGRIKWVDDSMMVLSKLGEHHIVLTPLDHLVKEYNNSFDSIAIYRWKGLRP